MKSSKPFSPFYRNSFSVCIPLCATLVIIRQSRMREWVVDFSALFSSLFVPYSAVSLDHLNPFYWSVFLLRFYSTGSAWSPNISLNENKCLRHFLNIRWAAIFNYEGLGDGGENPLVSFAALATMVPRTVCAQFFQCSLLCRQVRLSRHLNTVYSIN